MEKGGEKTDRKISLAAVTLLAVIIAVTPLFATVQAAPRVIVWRVFAAGIWFTATSVVLGDANNTICIPDNWNGDLVVYCRGFTPTLNPNEIPMQGWMMGGLLDGFATAASNYGSGGYCIQEAIIRTHQLTEYVIENYDITGNVFLLGSSMGGGVALQLAAKYPDLYDGALDVCGGKNATMMYETSKAFAEMNDAQIIARLGELGLPVPPYPYNLVPGPLTVKLAAFRNFHQVASDAIALECGGTPEEKPKAYERFSAVSYADIKIPVITLAGALDGIVLLAQQFNYREAVVAAGSGDLYRLVIVPNGAHNNKPIAEQVAPQVGALVDWVKTGIPPP